MTFAELKPNVFEVLAIVSFLISKSCSVEALESTTYKHFRDRSTLNGGGVRQLSRGNLFKMTCFSNASSSETCASRDHFLFLSPVFHEL